MEINEESVDKSKLEEEIDINDFINIFLRNKKSIFITSIIFLIIGIIYSSFQKKIWMGKFEIVLDKPQSPLSSAIIPGVLGRTLNLPKTSSLDTEVGILNSQSVLLPIYNYVLSEKKKSNPKANFTFDGWNKAFLTIKLKKKTSILQISYIDSDKELILPVLNKIKVAYQDYTGKNKKIDMSYAKKYLNDQIDIYSKNTSESIRLAQEYAIDKDLSILDLTSKDRNKQLESFLPNIPNSFLGSSQSLNLNPQTSNSFGNLISIEENRVSAANKIRRIENKIEEINSLPDNSEEMLFLVMNSPNLVEDYKALNELNFKILNAKNKYKENSPYFKLLLSSKNSLYKELKSKKIGQLKAEKLIAESQMKAAQRPKEVILKYKELIRKANRDEDTLVALENQLISMELEEARIEKPWRLISTPTVLNKPVSKSKTFYGLISLILGFFSGYIGFWIKEQKSDIIYEPDFVKNLFSAPIISKVNLLNNNEIKRDNFLNLYFYKLSENVNIIPCGIKEENILNNLIELFREINEDKNLKKDININISNIKKREKFFNYSIRYSQKRTVVKNQERY